MPKNAIFDYFWFLEVEESGNIHLRDDKWLIQAYYNQVEHVKLEESNRDQSLHVLNCTGTYVYVSNEVNSILIGK